MPPIPSVLLLHGVGSSAATWWRMTEDLAELGWDVTALDLLGHGSRTAAPGRLRRWTDFTTDVETQLDADRTDAARTEGGRFDLVVGHSLGALVALDLLARRPGAARLVVLEDPPSLGGSFTVGEVADGLTDDVRRVQIDPAAEEQSLVVANPRWAARDVAAYVASRRALDIDAVATLLRTASWDLADLVERCPVPVALVAAEGPDSMLVEPGRASVLALVPATRTVTIPGGHGLHRDRPARWLQAVLALAASG